jgi:hypothetical protein
MLTLTLQSINTLVKILFVPIALLIVREAGSDRSFLTVAWRWVAAAFLVSGISSLVQGVWAIVAFRGGAGSMELESYIAWMPALNYSRFSTAIFLAIGLATLPYLPAQLRPYRLTMLIGLAAGAGLVGVLLGFAEGPFVRGLHNSRLSVLQLVETLVLFAALWVAVVRRTMDLWLWLCLFIYAFRQSINSLIWAGTAWGVLPGVWHPPFWTSPALGIGMWVLMVGIAGHRLLHSRRGAPIAPVFSPAGTSSVAESAPGISSIHR